MESDLLWLHLPVLDIHLVAAKHHRDVVAHSAMHQLYELLHRRPGCLEDLHGEDCL